MRTAEDLMRLEEKIERKAMEIGRELYRGNVQPVVDGMPRIGSDGAPLTEGRTVDFTMKTQYGDVKLRGFCGRCRKTGEFEIPFKVRFCRGERCAMSPLLERNAAGSARLTRSTAEARRHGDLIEMRLRSAKRIPTALKNILRVSGTPRAPC